MTLQDSATENRFSLQPLWALVVIIDAYGTYFFLLDSKCRLKPIESYSQRLVGLFIDYYTLDPVWNPFPVQSGENWPYVHNIEHVLSEAK